MYVNIYTIARVHSVQSMNADWAPSDRQPSDQANWLGLWVQLQTAIIYTHRHHLLLLLSTKADTHFTVPQRVEGWVDLGGWLHTEMFYTPADGHPPKYKLGPTWSMQYRPTLIETSALSLKPCHHRRSDELRLKCRWEGGYGVQRHLARCIRAPLTLWRPLLPYGYSCKASCARPD